MNVESQPSKTLSWTSKSRQQRQGTAHTHTFKLTHAIVTSLHPSRQCDFNVLAAWKSLGRLRHPVASSSDTAGERSGRGRVAECTSQHCFFIPPLSSPSPRLPSLSYTVPPPPSLLKTLVFDFRNLIKNQKGEDCVTRASNLTSEQLCPPSANVVTWCCAERYTSPRILFPSQNNLIYFFFCNDDGGRSSLWVVLLFLIQWSIL